MCPFRRALVRGTRYELEMARRGWCVRMVFVRFCLYLLPVTHCTSGVQTLSYSSRRLVNLESMRLFNLLLIITIGAHDFMVARLVL